MADDTELEDLLALVESPGWKRFYGYANEQWSSKAYRTKARNILRNLSQEQAPNSANHLLQLEASAQAVEQLFEWVDYRIKTLRHMHEREVAQ